MARLAETALDGAALVAPTLEDPTNTGSGSNEDEDEAPLDPVVVISNDKSTEFFLATVAEEAAWVFAIFDNPAIGYTFFSRSRISNSLREIFSGEILGKESCSILTLTIMQSCFTLFLMISYTVFLIGIFRYIQQHNLMKVF